MSLMSQGPMPWDKPRCVSAGPLEGLAALKEEEETHLHPLVADGSEVPGPSLEHSGGHVRCPWGHRQPPQSALPPTLLRPGQPETLGWLTTGPSPREQPRCESSTSHPWGSPRGSSREGRGGQGPGPPGGEGVVCGETALG